MDTIRSLLNLLDIANYLPDLSTFSATAKLILWVLMLAGPALMLVLGVLYFTKPPAEANYSFGFRSYVGMGSVEAWRFTQRVAGLIWMAVGGGMTLLALGAGIFMLIFNAGQAAVLAIWAVSIELLLVIISWAVINVIVMRKYDRHGNLRGAAVPEAEEYPEEEESPQAENE